MFKNFLLITLLFAPVYSVDPVYGYEDLNSNDTDSEDSIKPLGNDSDTEDYPERDLEQTRKRPREIKMHACDWPGCDYETNRKGILSTHIASKHNKLTRYSCEHPGCDYKAYVKKDIDRHYSMVHLGERNYYCPSCDYQAPQSSDLRRHIEIVHDKVKRFVCAYCNNKYVQKSDLLIHMVSQHNNQDNFTDVFLASGGDLSKIKSCEYCGYQCMKNRDFMNHNRICKERSVAEKRDSN